MKDINYFPFERNRYFYGKLLSVEDFQREQAYMNRKRWLLNRLLYGDGVLCGMQVLEVNEESISIEMGVALDQWGREIVVEHPVVKRLSVIDGFAEHCVEQEKDGTVYLCIAYQEEETTPVHSIGASGNEEGKPLECSKIREGYRLFLTSEEPQENIGFSGWAYEEVKTIFQGQGIRLRQAVPRFLEKNQESVIRVWMDKDKGLEPVSFQYEMELTGITCQGKSHITVSFRETDREPLEHYEMEYTVRSAVEELDGEIRICSDSFVLEFGDYKQAVLANGQFRFQVVSEKREQRIWDFYYQRAAEDILNPAWYPPIYLAELSVIQAGDTYVIDGIRNLPYRQYVWNNRLLGTYAWMKLERPFRENRYNIGSLTAEKPEQQTMMKGQMYASGVAEISLGIGGTAGQVFYSEEIVHGLGLGVVFLSVGAVCPKKRGREIVYGTRDIFSEEKGQVNVETAVKLNMDRGSFVIGLRCLEEVHEDCVTVYWLAVREKEDMGIERCRTLSIRPGMPRICVRQSVYLEALIGEERQTGIKWEVKDAEGGSIDESGRYTAPNRPGIYEIRAYSPEDKTLEAAAYVIVGEEHS